MATSPLTLTRTLTREDAQAVAVFFTTQLGEEAASFLHDVLDYVSPGETNKRQRVDEVGPEFLREDEVDDAPITLIIQIPEDKTLISHIIGKGGANVTAVSSTTGCRVQIEKLGTRGQDIFRHIIIQGTVRTAIEAFKQIQSKASELSGGSFVEVTRLVIPSDLVAHVIGKGGQCIKELQEVTKCQRIDAQQESDMIQRTSIGVYGRTLTIMGDMHNRNHALYLLLRQLSQDKSLPDSWKGVKETPRLVLSAGGIGGGFGGLVGGASGAAGQQAQVARLLQQQTGGGAPLAQLLQQAAASGGG